MIRDVKLTKVDHFVSRRVARRDAGRKGLVERGVGTKDFEKK